MTNNIRHILLKLSPGAKTFWEGIWAGLTFAAASIAESAIQTHMSDSWISAGAKLAAFACAFGIFVWTGTKIRKWLLEEQLRDEERRQRIARASSLAEQAVLSEVEIYNRSHDASQSAKSDALRRLCDTSVLNELIEKAYDFMESEYGEGHKLDGRIEFEATFMTKSYIDQEITIPAHANRVRRAPSSLAQRQHNPKIYRDSVTNELYSEIPPVLRIVENTEDTENYKELYKGQKSRIKSCIVMPVLSNSNALMGTLVVHCDRKYFFLSKDRAYWSAVFEVFCRHLAVCKAKLDFAVSVSTERPF